MIFKDAQSNAVLKFKSPEFITKISSEDSSMVEHLDILQKINKNGFITIESQAGKKIINSKKKFEIHERSYLQGFMLETDAIKFIKNINIFTDKVAVNIPLCENSVRLIPSLDIPLTITKRDDNIIINTHTSMALPKNVWDMYIKEVKLNKNEKVVLLMCWDIKWNRNASSLTGLFTDVLNILENL